MKNRVLKLATGLLTVGALGVATMIGSQAVGVVETTAVVMKQNDASSLTGTESYKEVTKYKDLKSFEKSLGSDKKVAYIYSKGYQGTVLLVANARDVYTRDTEYSDDKAKNYCSDAMFYTEAGGVVRCIGRLNPEGSGGDISITDNGIIFATGKRDGLESYLVSKDGMDVVHKDYLEYSSGWGYYNESNDQSKRVEFTNDQTLIDKIQNLRDKAKIVEFRSPEK